MHRSSPGKRVGLAARARREFLEIVRWYRAESPRAAAGFQAAFKDVVLLLSEAPSRWAEVAPEVRRFVMQRYPYNVLYTVSAERVEILTVMHHARDPEGAVIPIPRGRTSQ